MTSRETTCACGICASCLRSQINDLESALLSITMSVDRHDKVFSRVADDRRVEIVEVGVLCRARDVLKKNCQKRCVRIVIEGPDGTGKTNVAKRLSEILGVSYYKSTTEKSIFLRQSDPIAVLNLVTREQLHIVSALNLDVVFDRFIPSEFAYSKAYKRCTSAELLFEHDSTWNDIGGSYVFLDKPKPDKEWSDDLVKIEMYDTIRSAYEEFKTLTKCRHITIDTSDRDIDSQVSRILLFLKREQLDNRK